MTSLRPLLLACSLSQVGCTPIVYEIVDGHDHGSTSTAEPTGGEPPTTGDTTGPSCFDGEWNGEESDLDCGGPCQPCPAGQHCKEPIDCIDQQCFDGMCGGFDCPMGECPPPGPCLRWACDPKSGCMPVPDDEGMPCDADDLCVFAGKCSQGECLGPTLDCSNLATECRASSCNPATGNCEIEWIAEGEPCDDGLACTDGEQCIQGECSSKMFPPPLPVLTTDFSVPDGWSADPPWQIGMAIPSKCSDKGADDPFEDHTPGFDEQLAGALIGDCLPDFAFPPACLTSPQLDVKEFPGELWLTYWSVLNTAGFPMDSRVDVFDGKLQSWTTLAKFPDFTAEKTWTEHTHDLTPYVGPGLRIRFCHSAMGQAPMLVGGWSLDDISVGPLMCE